MTKNVPPSAVELHHQRKTGGFVPPDQRQKGTNRHQVKAGGAEEGQRKVSAGASGASEEHAMGGLPKSGGRPIHF